MSLTVKLTQSDEIRLNKTGKRSINPSEWAANKRKRLRDSGESYTSKRGAIIPGKTPPTEVLELVM